MTDRKMLEQLVKIANRFRATPIIDDDFESIRDEFDFLLKDAAVHLGKPIPKRSVIIDGCMGEQQCLVEFDGER